MAQVVSTQLVSLLRERYAQKRRGTTQPIDAVADPVVDPASWDGRQQHVINLQIDLAAVMHLLTPLQRQIVDHLRREPLVRRWEGRTMTVDITRKVPASEEELYQLYISGNPPEPAQ